MTAAIDRLFKLMCEQGASDLHLCVGMPPLVRKDGSIQMLELGAPALDATTMTSLLEPIMPSKNREEFAKRHDTDFAYEIPGLARFRANAFVDRKGSGAVFRVRGACSLLDFPARADTRVSLPRRDQSFDRFGVLIVS